MNLSSEELPHSELIEAQAHVWNQILSYIKPLSLKCAVELGIPDLIHQHGEPMSLSKLVAALSIHPNKSLCVYRLMRVLVHSGFFSIQKHEQEECYVLTKSSHLLLKNNPLSLTPFLHVCFDHKLVQTWDILSTWFLNNDPKITTPFDFMHGRSIWDYASDEQKFDHRFNELMANDSCLISRVLMNDDECKSVFDGLSSLVDVGGGTGIMSKAIAKAFPYLDCTVLDLPRVVSGLQGSHNLKYVGADMFEAIPQADAILLKWILHDWDDEKCLKILENCKQAIEGRKEGKLIIIDMIIMENRQQSIADYGSIETQLLFDMVMMMPQTGRERTEKEWAKLFLEAGFKGYKVKSKLGLRSLIEVYP